MITNLGRNYQPSLSIMVLSGLLWLGCSGCSGGPQPPERKQTSPVIGIVVVDGQPVEMLEASCHDVKLLGTDASVISTAYTDATGKLELSSYVEGDGLPDGDYVLTFLLGQLDIVSRNYVGPDKLKDRYKSPQESTVKFTVKQGTPIDLGKIELITK